MVNPLSSRSSHPSQALLGPSQTTCLLGAPSDSRLRLLPQRELRRRAEHLREAELQALHSRAVEELQGAVVMKQVAVFAIFWCSLVFFPPFFSRRPSRDCVCGVQCKAKLHDFSLLLGQIEVSRHQKLEYLKASRTPGSELVFFSRNKSLVDNEII